MVEAWVTALIVLAVITVIVLFILSKTLYIVRQAQGIVIERLGRFSRVLKPGVSIVVPFIDSPRSFTWNTAYIDVNGRVIVKTTTDTRIDLRESVFNFLRQEVYTKDTVLVDVNSLMYYSIGDIKQAIYEVDDLQSAIQNVAQTQLKEVFGSMTLAEALASQTYINNHMRKNFARTFEKWGIKVHRIELQDMKPASQTAMAMKKQMIAERMRRGEFIQAEGNKAAMRLVAEGARLVKFNMGVADQESTRKRSEGEAQAKVALAKAERNALDTIAAAIRADGCSQTDFMIAQRYMDLLRGVCIANVEKTLYLPYEISHVSGLIADLPSVYGAKQGSSVAAAGGAPARAPPADEFEDLS